LNCSLWSAFQKHSPCYWSFYCFHSCWIQDGTLWYRFHILGCPTTKQLNSVSACVMQTFWWIFLRCYHGHQFARYIVLYSSTSWCTLGFFFQVSCFHTQCYNSVLLQRSVIHIPLSLHWSLSMVHKSVPSLALWLCHKVGLSILDVAYVTVSTLGTKQ
jgi:hypothetical protein